MKYPLIPLKQNLCIEDGKGNSVFKYDEKRFLVILKEVNPKNISEFILLFERAKYDIMKIKRYGRKMLLTVENFSTERQNVIMSE